MGYIIFIWARQAKSAGVVEITLPKERCYLLVDKQATVLGVRNSL